MMAAPIACNCFGPARTRQGVDTAALNEFNRDATTRSANRYLKHIRYGNGAPYFPTLMADRPAPLPSDWLFELVFDYGERDADAPVPSGARPRDPFSTHRAGFEIRTYRLCRRALMFHHFPDDPAVGENCLVRSTRFLDGRPCVPHITGPRRAPVPPATTGS
jgi:hypothetical protein